MNKFKTQEIEMKYSAWRCQHPNSTHPYDRERWNELVLALLENNEDLSIKERDELLKKNDSKVEFDVLSEISYSFYIEDFNRLKEFYELMKKNGYSRHKLV